MSETERALRRRLSLLIVAALAVAVATSHAIESGLSYPLGSEPLHHGTYGLELAQIPPADSRRRVVLLGKSVYQISGVVERMHARIERERLDLELVNLAQVGSGIDDHVVQAVKAVETRPDLVVVCVGDLTFTTCLPIFRTTADLLCFDPAYATRVPASFYRRHFGLGKALSGVATSVVPFPRCDPILRHDWMRSRAGQPRWLYERLRFPTLHLTGDAMDAAQQGFEVDYASFPPYPHALEAVEEMLGVVRPHAVLVIWQECAPIDWADGLVAQVRARVEREPAGRFVDLRGHYDPSRFMDIVHPNAAELEPYAARHLQAILDALPARR